MSLNENNEKCTHEKFCRSHKRWARPTRFNNKFFVMICNLEHPYRSLMQQQFKISMKLTDLKTLKKLNMDINYSLSEDSFKNISEKN